MGEVSYGCPTGECDELFLTEEAMLEHIEKVHGIKDFVYVHDDKDGLGYFEEVEEQTTNTTITENEEQASQEGE